jgi:transcriptional regulator with XRE-family HTH domain
MRSSVHTLLPPKVRASLRKLGADLLVARRRRGLTVTMMVERTGVAKSTYLRLEKGDPTVALGVYAMALFALGFGEVLGGLADVHGDEVGLSLEAERLPKRVRVPKTSLPS